MKPMRSSSTYSNYPYGKWWIDHYDLYVTTCSTFELIPIFQQYNLIMNEQILEDCFLHALRNCGYFWASEEYEQRSKHCFVQFGEVRQLGYMTVIEEIESLIYHLLESRLEIVSVKMKGRGFIIITQCKLKERRDYVSQSTSHSFYPR